jgi:hypothetical protein
MERVPVPFRVAEHVGPMFHRCTLSPFPLSPCGVPTVSAFLVVASRVVTSASGARTMSQVPSFILPASLGLPSIAAAEEVARAMLTVPGVPLRKGWTVEVWLGVSPVAMPGM